MHVLTLPPMSWWYHWKVPVPLQEWQLVTSRGNLFPFWFYLKFFIGYTLHISAVISFRVQKRGFQQNKPEPLFRYTWADLTPNPGLFLCQVVLYIPFLYGIDFIFLITLATLPGRSANLPIFLLKALFWGKIRLSVRISALNYSSATY